MIYLNHTTDSQILLVPRSYPAEGSLSLELEGTISKVVTTHSVIDIKPTSQYFNLAIALPESADCGEYEYRLKDASGDILSQGILYITDVEEIEQYEKSIQYEQYTE